MRIIRKKNAGSCGFNENVRFKNIERLYMLFLFFLSLRRKNLHCLSIYELSLSTCTAEW